MKLSKEEEIEHTKLLHDRDCKKAEYEKAKTRLEYFEARQRYKNKWGG